jgi:hypothetical protein
MIQQLSSQYFCLCIDVIFGHYYQRTFRGIRKQLYALAVSIVGTPTIIGLKRTQKDVWKRIRTVQRWWWCGMD